MCCVSGGECAGGAVVDDVPPGDELATGDVPDEIPETECCGGSPSLHLSNLCSECAGSRRKYSLKTELKAGRWCGGPQ